MTQYDMCGSCSAGIRLAVLEGPDGPEAFCVTRCHKCDLFATDEEASGEVQLLLNLLSKAYAEGQRGDTVSDAFAAIAKAWGAR